IFVAKSCGFIAQWLEHWSRKPGVLSSILTGACSLCCSFTATITSPTVPDLKPRSSLVGGKRSLLWNHINSGTPDFGSQKLQLCGFIAQWLEHWSCKPGVVSSILTGACSLRTSFTASITSTTVPDLKPRSSLVGGKRSLLWNHINSGTPDFGSQKLQLCGFIAQWQEHWSRKPGVVSSILTGACGLHCSFMATITCKTVPYFNPRSRLVR